MELNTFQSVLELLVDGDRAICVYTRGANLEIKSDGTGSSGWWAISPRRECNRVVIYKYSEIGLDAELYVANHDGVEGPRPGSDSRDRYLIRLTGIKLVGTTAQDWKTFAAAGQNPVRYISRRNSVKP